MGIAQLERGRVRSLFEDERARFVAAHPRSLELYERGKRSLLAGVPAFSLQNLSGSSISV
jgi:hypothetical protein